MGPLHGLFSNYIILADYTRHFLFTNKWRCAFNLMPFVAKKIHWWASIVYPSKTWEKRCASLSLLLLQLVDCEGRFLEHLPCHSIHFLHKSIRPTRVKSIWTRENVLDPYDFLSTSISLTFSLLQSRYRNHVTTTATAAAAAAAYLSIAISVGRNNRNLYARPCQHSSALRSKCTSRWSFHFNNSAAINSRWWGK